MKDIAINSYSWTTEFDRNNNLMIHYFCRQVEIVTDFNNKRISLWKNDEKIYSFGIENFNELKDYENLLLRTAKEVDQLEVFAV